MKKLYVIAAVGAVFFPATAGRAGGPGAVVTAIHGQVEIQPLQRHCRYLHPSSRGTSAEPFGPGSSWRRAKRGELEGTFLIRTGPRSRVHLRYDNRNVACIDSNSLIQIRSGCGFEVKVIRGQASPVDGRETPRLASVFSDISLERTR